MQVSDTLYVADMGDNILVQVEMTGMVESNGKTLKAYKVTSSNNKISGYFEQEPDGNPVELIQTLVKVHLDYEDIKKNSGIHDE